MLLRGQGRVLNLDKTLPPSNCITNCSTPLHNKQVSFRPPKGHQDSDSASSVRLPQERFVRLPGERQDFGGQSVKCPDAPPPTFRGRKSPPPQDSPLLTFRGRADGPPFSKVQIPVRREQSLSSNILSPRLSKFSIPVERERSPPSDALSPKPSKTPIPVRREQSPPSDAHLSRPKFDHPNPPITSRRPQK